MYAFIYLLIIFIGKLVSFLFFFQSNFAIQWNVADAESITLSSWFWLLLILARGQKQSHQQNCLLHKRKL